MPNGRYHSSGQMSRTVAFSSGADDTKKGVVSDCVSTQYSMPNAPIGRDRAFVRAPGMSACSSETAHRRAPTPAQIFVRLVELNTKSSIEVTVAHFCS